MWRGSGTLISMVVAGAPSRCHPLIRTTSSSVSRPAHGVGKRLLNNTNITTAQSSTTITTNAPMMTYNLQQHIDTSVMIMPCCSVSGNASSMLRRSTAFGHLGSSSLLAVAHGSASSLRLASTDSNTNKAIETEKKTEDTKVVVDAKKDSETSKTAVEETDNTTAAGETPKDGAAKKPDVPLSRVLQAVLSHLWPVGRWDLRACVVGSISAILVNKVLKIGIPFWFKTIIDTLAAAGAAVTSAQAVGETTSAAAALASDPVTVGAAVAVVGPFTVGVLTVVAAYGITRITALFCDESKTAIFAPVGAHAATTISLELFQKLHSLDLRFHLNRQTGVLAKDLDRGSRAFWSLAYALIFMIIPTLFEMCLVGAVLHTQAGTSLAIVAATAVASYLGWTYMVTQWRAYHREIYNAADSKVGGMVVDSLLNYETVKYFTNEKYEQGRVEKATIHMNHHLKRLDQNMALMNFGQQAIFAVAATVSLYLCTTSVLAGAMTVGDIVLVDALLLQLYMPLSWLGMLYREVQGSTQNMQAMIKLMDEKDAIAVNTATDVKPFVFQKGTIELQNITFQYNEKRKVLQNLSLTIPGGKTVAFVGPSGCGKSTIFRLLFRFFDPSEGRILIDGQPLNEINLESFRGQVGVVPQDTVLFNDTIGYNVAYGKVGASHEEVERATKAAHVHDAIANFPDKYETVVGERGLKLSGGEKQRVAIARVILKDAPMLFADEATSALDPQTERSVMKTLRETASLGGKRRTLVIIAHRLTTVKDADIIFVLDKQGALVEQGTHTELLLREDGLYRGLWEEQNKIRKVEMDEEEALLATVKAEEKEASASSPTKG